MIHTKEAHLSVREDQLQFLRFIAFLNIYIHHTVSWEVISYPSWNAALLPVSFFFMLSGVLCGYRASQKNCKLTPASIFQDMKHKVKKVYGLHLITNLFMACSIDLLILVKDFRSVETVAYIKQLLRNLLLIQSWFSEGFFEFNGATWYLSTLMFLYLFNIPLTLIIQKVDKNNHRQGICIFAILLSFVLTAIYSWFTNTDQIHFLQYIFPPARLGQYICGVFLGYLIYTVKPKIPEGNNMRILFSVAELGVLFFWILSLKHSFSWHNRLVDWFVPNILLIGIFLLGRGLLSSLFRFKPLVRLGDITLECFLIHQVVLHLFRNIGSMEPNTALEKLFCSGFCLMLTLVTSFYINNLQKVKR